jgi:hypothetical protein
MKKTILGKLEEVVRLVVAAITEDLYGALVMEQFQKQIGRRVEALPLALSIRPCID